MKKRNEKKQSRIKNKQVKGRRVQKRKNSNVIEINFFGFLVVVAIIIFLIISIFVKNNYYKKNKEIEQVKKYAIEMCSDADYMGAMQHRTSFEEKLYYVTEKINQENGTVLEKIPEDMLKDKYKKYYGEELEITEHAFMLPNYYSWDYETRTLENDNYKNMKVSNESTASQAQKNNSIIQIQECKKKNKNEFEVNINLRDTRPVIEFLEYNRENENANFDTEKLNKMLENSSYDQNDYEYLVSLVNEENIEYLTMVSSKVKIIVEKNGNDYKIIDYENGI